MPRAIPLSGSRKASYADLCLSASSLRAAGAAFSRGRCRDPAPIAGLRGQGQSRRSPFLSVLRDERSVGADIVSGGELTAALAAGMECQQHRLFRRRQNAGGIGAGAAAGSAISTWRASTRVKCWRRPPSGWGWARPRCYGSIRMSMQAPMPRSRPAPATASSACRWPMRSHLRPAGAAPRPDPARYRGAYRQPDHGPRPAGGRLSPIGELVAALRARGIGSPMSIWAAGWASITATARTAMWQLTARWWRG